MTTGMILGKFMPPHLGHVYLCEFASGYVDELTIVVCSLEREPIAGHLRYEWMRELLPQANVVHLTEELPQEPGEHPDFWALWKAALERVLPGVPDFVFASEDYGAKLAEVLGGRFVPVDRARSAVPVSGSAIRADPMANWGFIPRCVRPHFVKRVCVFGPESTGKSTLAANLAAHFRTCWVPEYARTFIESQRGAISRDDMLAIASGQIASEDALARNAQRVLICDTDVLTTCLWSETLFGACDPRLRNKATRPYDLTFLLDVDVPWVPDVVRFLPDDRVPFFARCRDALDAHGRDYVVLSGTWDERFDRACQAVASLISCVVE